MRGSRILKSSSYGIFLWIATFNFFLYFTGAFRFCYKGWQEVNSSVCPYGVLFEDPVPMSCSYENNRDDSASFWEDVCDSPFHMNIAVQNENKDEENLAHNLPDIQFIQYRSKEPGPLRESPDVVDLTECIATCPTETDAYAYTDDPDDGDDEFVVANDSELQLQIKEQTLRLGDYMYDIMFNNSVDVELDFRIVDLLKLSFDVIKQVCPPPYVSLAFLDRVIQGFLFLLQDSGTGTVKDIHSEEYQDIKEGLEDCMGQPANFQLDGNVCTSRASVERIVVTENGKQKVRPWLEQSNMTENFYALDLFIDTTWRVIDVVHAVCFVHFKPNSNMHHRFQTAMEELFTPDIKTRWSNPTQLIDNAAWSSWFLADIESTLRNVFACQRGAYLNTPFEMKLDRPIDNHRFRRRRDVSNLEMDSSPRNIRKKRSPPTSMSSIMSNYAGIQKTLKGEMFCLKSAEEQTTVLSKLKSRC